MTARPLPAADPAADWARPLYADQIPMLGELAETGLEIARQAARLAKDAWDVEGVHTASLAHTRVARAVRLTLMLRARLIKALEDRDTHWGADRDALPEARVRDERRDNQVRRIVEQVAAHERDDAEDIEHLVREAAERLDEDDIHDLLERPVSELVALICKDLGLNPDWPQLAQEAWAQEEMASGAAGWPLAGLSPFGLDDPRPAVIQGQFRPSG